MPGITAWTEGLTALVRQIEPRFARSEARLHAAAYLRGLLGWVERKNSWQHAEAVGDANPYGIQQFLYRATWDPWVRLQRSVADPADVTPYVCFAPAGTTLAENGWCASALPASEAARHVSINAHAAWRNAPRFSV